MKLANILVPVDLSEVCEDVLTKAAELAVESGATLHLLNVLNPALFMPIGLGVPQNDFNNMIEDSTKELERLGVRLGNIRVVCRADVGDAATMIESYVNACSIDLVVIATHGRRGFSHLVVGSTTERVVRRVSCPVLTMHLTKSPAPSKKEAAAR